MKSMQAAINRPQVYSCPVEINMIMKQTPRRDGALRMVIEKVG